MWGKAGRDFDGMEWVKGQFDLAGSGVVPATGLTVAVEDLIELGEVLEGVGIAVLLNRLVGGCLFLHSNRIYRDKF